MPRAPKVKVTIPDIEIPFVPAHEERARSTYRVCFDICLTFTGILLGLLLSDTDQPVVFWLFLALVSVGDVAFPYLAFRPSHRPE
jgi:hypothetical protein